MTVSGGLVHRRTDIEQVSRGWCDGSAIQIHECVNPGHASLDVGFRGDPCGRPEGASSVCSRCMQLTRMRLWARHDYRLAQACTVITFPPVRVLSQVIQRMAYAPLVFFMRGERT